MRHLNSTTLNTMHVFAVKYSIWNNEVVIISMLYGRLNIIRLTAISNSVPVERFLTRRADYVWVMGQYVEEISSATLGDASNVKIW